MIIQRVVHFDPRSVTSDGISEAWPVDDTASLTFRLGNILIATNEGGTLRYVHPDSLGSSSVATDASGTVVGSQTYKPFGETWASTGAFGTDRKFTGQRLDGGSGLYFYNARYYDPGVGRFVSADSTVPDESNPQDYNRYSYVRNNPLIYTDPTGLSCVLYGITVSAGFIAGGSYTWGIANCNGDRAWFSTTAINSEAGWEVGISITVTIVYVDTLDQLNSDGMHVGGSAGLPTAPWVSIGGEVLIDPSTGSLTGGSGSVQGGVGSKAEGHYGKDSTTIYKPSQTIRVHDMPSNQSLLVPGRIYQDPSSPSGMSVYVGGLKILIPITPDLVAPDGSDGNG